jgi:hypothetical protein
VGHVQVPGDFTIAPGGPLRVAQQARDAAFLVFARKSHAVLSVGAEAVEDGVSPCAMDPLSVDVLSAEPQHGLDTMKPAREPVDRTIVEDAYPWGPVTGA